MKNNILIEVSIDTLRRAIAIREQMEKLHQELNQITEPLASISGHIAKVPHVRNAYRKIHALPPETLTPKKLHYSQTPAGRAAISRRMKVSWRRRQAQAAQA